MEWIPTKERPPEKDGVYVVTIDPDYVHPGDSNVVDMDFRDGEWLFYFFDKADPHSMPELQHMECPYPILAWAELPEPYEEKRDRFIAESEIYKVFSGIAKLPRHVIEDVLMFAPSSHVTKVECTTEECRHHCGGFCGLLDMDMDKNAALGGCFYFDEKPEIKEINDE